MTTLGVHVVGTDGLEVTHQGDRLFVGDGDLFHIDDRITQFAREHRISHIVHIGEAIDMNRAVDRLPAGA